MDDPLLFLAEQGADRLICLCVDQQDEERLYLVADCPDGVLAERRSGKLPLTGAFLVPSAKHPPFCWLIQADPHFSLKEITPQNLSDLSEGFLPDVAVRLT